MIGVVEMKINNERATQIDIYILNHSEAEIGKWPLEIGGEKTILPYFRLPIELLRYYLNNGRLAIDLQEWEKESKRKLDPDQEEDARVIFDKLVNLDPSKTKNLKDDIEKKGQMEPGVITNDGYVVNGNRRMAVLQQLNSEQHLKKWEYLEAVRLPKNISEKDLWRLEAGLQLSKDKIAEYHPVNELLKIKQGIDTGLTTDQIAAALYGRTIEEIEESLDRLVLIDNFLEFFGQPKNYGLIRTFGLHEYFIDIQKNIMNQWEKKGVSKKDQYNQMIAAFALLRANIKSQKKDSQKKTKKSTITHWDMRELGRIFSDYDASLTFMENMIDGGKKIDVKKVCSIDPSAIIENFHGAKEILKNKDDRDHPIILIDRAIKAINSIDRKSIHFKGEKVKEALGKLSKLIEEISLELNS